MSSLRKERLNQMIENALSYKQEVRVMKSFSLDQKLKHFISRPKVYSLTFASLLISCICIPSIIISRNLVDLNELNDYITYEVIEDLKI